MIHVTIGAAVREVDSDWRDFLFKANRPHAQPPQCHTEHRHLVGLIILGEWHTVEEAPFSDPHFHGQDR